MGAYAFPAVLTDLRTRSRRCFLRSMTEKRSKSESERRAATCSRFLFQLEASHLLVISCFSMYFFTIPERAARGSFFTVNGVSDRWR